MTYDDYLADFSAGFHDLRASRGFREVLDPASYVASQALAEQLLDAGSLGVVYPSVRHARRHVRRVLPAGAGRQRAPGRHLPFYVGRETGAGDYRGTMSAAPSFAHTILPERESRTCPASDACRKGRVC